MHGIYDEFVATKVLPAATFLTTTGQSAELWRGTNIFRNLRWMVTENSANRVYNLLQNRSEMAPNSSRHTFCLTPSAQIMNKLLLVGRRVLLTLFSGYVVFSAGAQTNYYVRSGATGSNNGSDWNNAYMALPSSLKRGATYYVAAGTYAAPTFSDAENGTQLITITSATVTNHGTSTGWTNSYAGQALFMGETYFTTGYYLIDGQARGSDWRSGYTLRFWNSTDLSGAAIHLQASNITMRYVEIQGTTNMRDPNPNGTSLGDNGVYTDAVSGLSNFYIGYSYIHETGNTQFQMNLGVGDGFTCEYNYVYLDHTAWNANHDEAFSLTWSDSIIRYNFFHDINGTGVITDAAAVNISLSNWAIYGNVFFWDLAYAGSVEGYMSDGIIAMLGENMTGYMYVYNNTVANMQSMSNHSGIYFPQTHLFGCRPGGTVTMNVYNNLIFNCGSQGAPAGPNNPPPAFTGTLNWDYQSYYSLGGSANDTSAHAVVSSSNPFVNALPATSSSSFDFHLTAATAAGITLSSPYNTDMNGNTRGADGTWDRGAYEFVSNNTNPPVISSLQATNVSDRSATIIWATDQQSSSILLYGLSTSYGSAVTNSTLVTSHSITISNLTANTTYHYLAQSANATGYVGRSSDSTFTTMVTDTNPPTVSVVTPSPSTVIAGTTTLAANASDNGGVAGVQFLVDGSPIGSSITSAPYSYNWNSISVTNGNHSLRAKATDMAGNVATSAVVNVQIQNIVTNGLVGYWTFDEGSGTQAADSSGFGDTASLNTGAAWTTNAVLGAGALLLNAASAASASVPDSSALEISGDLTITMWVKHNSLPATNSWMYYLDKGQNSQENYGFGAYSDATGTRLFFEFIDATGTSRYYTQGTGLPLSSGVWTHVAVVFNHTSGQLSFFIKGQQVSSTTVSQLLTVAANPLVIGQQNITGYEFYLNGSIDDLRIYNRALTATEINTLSLLTTFTPPIPVIQN
jgi:hypothetical protein